MSTEQSHLGKPYCNLCMENRWQSKRSAKKIMSPHLPHQPTSLLRENVGRSTPNSYSSALLWLVKRLLTHKFYLHMSCHLTPHHCLIAVSWCVFPTKPISRQPWLRKYHYVWYVSTQMTWCMSLMGGALLQKLPWPNQTTYANLSNLYV